jgi:hypothetical protein
MASGFADKLRLIVSQGNDRLRLKEDAEERAYLAQLVPDEERGAGNLRLVY